MNKKVIAGFLSAAALAVCLTGCQSESGVSSNVTDPTASVEGNTGEVKLNDGDLYAIISIKDMGDITVKLYPDAAPKGVDNFVKLANDHFYDGKTFHRIMADFMAQGGAADNDSEYEEFGIETNYSMRHFYGALCYANALGKNTTQFYIVNSKTPQDPENYSIPTIDNNIQMYSDMANSVEQGSDEYNYYMFYSDYYSKIKDFINNLSDEAAEKYKKVGGVMSLDGNYTVFGQTVDGFDVLDKLSAVEVEENAQGEKSKPVNDVFIETVTIKTYGEES